MGFVNAGANVGAILAPIVVPWLAVNYGWQWAFIGTGLLGSCGWPSGCRSTASRTNTRASPRRAGVINSDPPEPTCKCGGVRC